jgi:hypothetical protein
MSNVPTDLSMNGMKLFTDNEIITCSIYNIKMLILIIIIFLVCGCITTCIKKATLDYKHTDRCKYQVQDEDDYEHFSNDQFYSYKNIDYASYQSIPLTPIGESLLFGQANRHIRSDLFTLDIFCNLYLLNGNVFSTKDEDKNKKLFSQKYVVYIVKDKDNRKFIGYLTAGSDQIYKLKFTDKNISKYVSFDHIEIAYRNEKLEESIMLNGHF